MIKKQGLKPKFKPIARGGWGGWIRTLIFPYFKNTYNQYVASFMAGSV